MRRDREERSRAQWLDFLSVGILLLIAGSVLIGLLITHPRDTLVIVGIFSLAMALLRILIRISEGKLFK